MTVDELITKFTLQDGPYRQGAERIVEASHKAVESIREATASVLEFGKAASEKLKFGELLAPLAAIGTTVGLAELLKQSVEVSLSFDKIQRQLIGITGSLERARHIMEFSESQSSRTGMFGTEELDQAAIKLEAFGLQTEKYLPSLEKLAYRMGGGADAVQEMVEALGKIQEGDPSRATRIFERFGVGPDQLRKQGVQYKGREVVSQPQQLLDAILKVSSQYDGVVNQMLNSPEAKIQRFHNVWDQLLRKTGDNIMAGLAGPLEKVDDFLEYLSTSGEIEKIEKSFADLFGSKDAKNVLLDGLAWMVATIESIPKVIDTMRTKFSEFFTFVKDNFIKIAEIIAAAFTFDFALQAFEAVTIAIKAMTAAIKTATIAEAILQAIATEGFSLIAAAALATAAAVGVGAVLNHLLDNGSQSFSASGSGSIVSDITKKHDQLIASFNKTTTKPGDGSDNGTTTTGQAETQTGYLSQIAANTKQANIDFKRFAFGGGDLGRLGVSPVELSGYTSSHSGHVGHGVGGKIAAVIEEAIGAEVNRRLGHANRQRLTS